jgi:hypothetical protein
VTKTLLYAAIAFLVVAEVVWGVIEHRQGWRSGHFSRGLTRYQPGYNVKTGRRGEPPAEGLRLALGILLVLAISWLLLSWAGANGS